MRSALLASIVLAAISVEASGQSATHEYRPEIVITSPPLYGFGAQFLYEQHLETGTLAPHERMEGFGIVSPTFFQLRAAIEMRQVQQPTVLEHRYIPTIYSTIPLGSGFELRNRTRVEIRDLAGAWSRRWQDRSAFGRGIDVMGQDVFTYVQLELSYDSRFSTLNRIDKVVGFRVPLTSRSSIDTFPDRQDDSRRDPSVLVAGGAVIRVSL
jgi:hypothetical protein